MGNNAIKISKNSNKNIIPLLVVTFEFFLLLIIILLLLLFILLLLILLLLLNVFISVLNSLLIISDIISRNLFDKILSIPSFDICSINTIVFKIIRIN